jgi:hypothetical protein
MAINDAWNNRCGPGGSARRLHHLWGRNRLDTRGKDSSFARHDTAVIGSSYKCQRQSGIRRRCISDRRGSGAPGNRSPHFTPPVPARLPRWKRACPISRANDWPVGDTTAGAASITRQPLPNYHKRPPLSRRPLSLTVIVIRPPGGADQAGGSLPPSRTMSARRNHSGRCPSSAILVTGSARA